MFTPISQKAIEEILPQYRSSLCGLTSLGNAINSLRQNNYLTPKLLAQIYLRLISFDGQNLPNPWRVFIPGQTDVYQSALMTIALAAGTKTQRFESSTYTHIENPTSTKSLIPYVNNHSKVIISVKSSFSLPNTQSSGSHLVLLDSFDNEHTKSFTIVDPYNPDLPEANIRNDINCQFLDSFFRGTGFIISTQDIPQTDFSFVPFATGRVKPGTKPWPVIVPNEVVDDIRNLLK